MIRCNKVLGSIMARKEELPKTSSGKVSINLWKRGNKEAGNTMENSFWIRPKVHTDQHSVVTMASQMAPESTQAGHDGNSPLLLLLLNT